MSASASTRFRADLQRSDTERVTTLGEIDTHTEHRNWLAFDPLTIAPDDDFTVAGLTNIAEVWLYTDGAACVVELTKAGPVSFQMPVNNVLYLNRVELAGLRVINPSDTSELSVQLLVGGQ